MAKALYRIKTMLRFFQKIRNKVNLRMKEKYSANLVGVSAAILCVLLLIIMLFVPPYLGVADDGSISKVMNSSGIYYVEDKAEDIYNNYFIKTYTTVSKDNNVKDDYMSSQVIMVKLAVAVDNFFTQDNYFDIRVLSLIYGLLFIPAIWLIVTQAALRVLFFSEGIIIGIVGVVIFADVSYITYFSSFYPEAIWHISFLYCVGLGLSLCRKRFREVKIVLFTIFGVILTTSKWQCGVIGLLLAALCVKKIFLDQRVIWKITCILMAFILSITTFVSYFTIEDDFTITSKYHAMTRGVLFQSKNPEETLKEFNIDASYSILADTSSYNNYPLVDANNDLLKEDFLDKYNTRDIVFYYVKHPLSMIGMLDISVKSAFNIRRDYSGNYEKSTGMKEKAKSLFWSSFSTFKVRSAPRTIGYLIILVIACFMLFGERRKLGVRKDESKEIYLDVMILVLCIGLSQGIITIIRSGDAEMIQHGFILGAAIDIITYFAFAEILHKLNIIEGREDTKNGV